MNRSRALLPPALCALAVLLTAGGAAAQTMSQAQTPATPRSGPAAEVVREVTAFREALRAAIATKDIAALRELYADTFTHTYGNARIEGKDDRILHMAKGYPSIEIAPAEELSFRIFGAATAVVTGRSTVLDEETGRNQEYRWLAVYVKQGGRWQIAASQMTRLLVAK